MCRSRRSSVSIAIAATASLVNHLWSAGMMCHRASGADADAAVRVVNLAQEYDMLPP